MDENVYLYLTASELIVNKLIFDWGLVPIGLYSKKKPVLFLKYNETTISVKLSTRGWRAGRPHLYNSDLTKWANHYFPESHINESKAVEFLEYSDTRYGLLKAQSHTGNHISIPKDWIQ